MDWHFWAALVVGLILASLADWLFAGVLFHDRYQTYPEVWRVNGNNRGGIIAAQLLTLPTVIGTIALVEWLGLKTLPQALLLAALIWAIAAGPAMIINGVFVKIDMRVVAAHTAGWLVKLLLVASAAVLIL